MTSDLGCQLLLFRVVPSILSEFVIFVRLFNLVPFFTEDARIKLARFQHLQASSVSHTVVRIVYYVS